MKPIAIALFFLYSLGFSSCATAPKLNSEQLAQTSAAETAAAASPTPLPSNTPIPTDTPAPSVTPFLTDSPVPTVTPTPKPDLTATAAVRATQTAGVEIAKLSPMLQKYDLSTDQGSLAWVQQKPVEINLDKYDDRQVVPTDSRLAFTDFAFYVEVTWESRSGLAGCGVAFHSEDNSLNGEQYRFFALRFSGLPGWVVQQWKEDRLLSFTTKRYKFNDAINLKQGSKNAFMLVMQEGLLTLYANEARLDRIEIPAGSSGHILFFGLQESMKTTCTFKNAWIWSLK